MFSKFVSSKELDRNSILWEVVAQKADVILNAVTEGGPSVLVCQIFALTKSWLDTGECLARYDARALLSSRSAWKVNLLTIQKILSSSGSSGSSSDLFVEEIIFLSQGAVYIEPPVTYEVLLVEDGSVWTEKSVLEEAANAVISANVEALAVCLRIAIVSFYLTIAGEGGIRWDAVHGVILARLPRYSLGQLPKLLAQTDLTRSSVKRQSLLARPALTQANCQSYDKKDGHDV